MQSVFSLIILNILAILEYHFIVKKEHESNLVELFMVIILLLAFKTRIRIGKIDALFICFCLLAIYNFVYIINIISISF